MIAIVSNTAVPPWARRVPRPFGARLCNTGAGLLLSRCRRHGGPEREGHRAFDDRLAVDARDAFEQAHPAAQANHGRFDDHHVARMTGRR